MTIFQSHQKIKFSVFAIIFSILLPFSSHARVKVSLAWEPGYDSSPAGYKVFSRIEGGVYNYSEPIWRGTETSCNIPIYDEEIPHYFVVRAFEENENESLDSKEACFGCTLCPDDPNKKYAGVCGCGIPDVDINYNGILDCNDMTVSPLIDIKANRSDDTVFISQGESLSISIELDPETITGVPVEWYILSKAPMGWLYYDGTKKVWLPGNGLTKQGPLEKIYPPLKILETFDFPIGHYTFYFGIDEIINNKIDLTHIYYDSVDVTITP